MSQPKKTTAVPAAPGKTKVFVVRFVGERSVDAFAKDPFSARFAPGDRVLLHEHAGGEPTGRAMLLRREALWVATWAWSRGAEDPARVLEPLSLEPAPGFSPTLNLG